MENLIDNSYTKKYISRMTDVMKKVNPMWTEDFIKSSIKDMIQHRGVNPKVELDNNYTGEHKHTSLLSTLEWYMNSTAILAGNGTFYKNQYEALNPISDMLEGWAAERSALKKEMFGVGEIMGFESDEYKDLDRGQNNKKTLMNSYYGASGAPSSAFYSKHSGPATTLTAQSVISTAEQFFEAFLADNYLFLNLTEAMDWLHIVLKEKHEIDTFIKRKSVDDTCERLVSKIIDKHSDDAIILRNYLSALTPDQVTMIYYKNNMIEFFKEHKLIRDIYNLIVDSIHDYNYIETDKKGNAYNPNWIEEIPKELQKDFVGKKARDWNKFVDRNYFMDPNKPPESVMKELKILTGYLMKYVFVRYLSFDRIYRLRNFERRVVTVIDTDSNFLSIDTLIKYLLHEVMNSERGRMRNFEYNEFITVNTITYVITTAIEDILLHYGKCSNIPEEYRPAFNMKNEFFNALLIIGRAKKRYISKQILREGNKLNPPKSDIKGFDFKKSTTSEYAESVFMELINNFILKSENIDIRGLNNGLLKFKKDIVRSIDNGELTFLPNGSAKDKEAYADPGSEQAYRGMLVWNMLNPDNMIETPSKVSLVKLNLFTEEDLEKLRKPYPEIYEILNRDVFHDTTGIFIVEKEVPGIDYVSPSDEKWLDGVHKKYRSKFKNLSAEAWNAFVDKVRDDICECECNGKVSKYAKDMQPTKTIKSRGVQVLAIPSNSMIPDWCKPFIDYSTMANSIISPFKPILEIFNCQFIEEGKTYSKLGLNRKSNTVSNIIKF